MRLYVVRRFGVREWAVQNRKTGEVMRHCASRREARAVSNALNEALAAQGEQQQLAV